MGPYCKFCDTRCFIPTEEYDYIKRDLKATCREGIIFDLTATYEPIVDKDLLLRYWLKELRRGETHSIALQLINGKIYEFEIDNKEIELILNLSNLEMSKRVGKSSFYRLVK